MDLALAIDVFCAEPDDLFCAEDDLVLYSDDHSSGSQTESSLSDSQSDSSLSGSQSNSCLSGSQSDSSLSNEADDSQPSPSSSAAAVPAVPVISQAVLNHPIFARSRVQRLPSAREHFDEIFLAEGVPLVFKPLAFDAFAQILGQRQPVVLRRPNTFGLRTFVSALAARIDVDFHPQEDPFLALNQLLPSKWSGHGLHAYHVLHLDLGPFGGTDLREDLLKYVYAQCLDFLRHHRLDIKLPSMHSMEGRPELLMQVLQTQIKKSFSPCPVFVFIQDFDNPLYTYHDCFETLQSFLRNLTRLVGSGAVGGLLLYSSLDDGTIGACRGREPGQPMRPKHTRPIFLSQSASLIDFSHTLDLSHHPAFHDAIGFTPEDIDALENALRHLVPTPESAPPLMQLVKEERIAAYFFLGPHTVPDNLTDVVKNIGPCPREQAVYSAGAILTLIAEHWGLPGRKVFHRST